MPNLILIPTSFERERLLPKIADVAADNDWQIELVGFGPIAAASRSAMLISRDQPKRVCLIGIAGSFGDVIPLGSAAAFSSVVSYGIGAGTGQRYIGATNLGWPMIESSGERAAIGERIELASSGGCLLTCSAASADETDVEQRRSAYPQATAEDMEGFGVALSCQLAAVPLSIVRGVSNRAGDRDQVNWKIDEAIDAAADLAIRVLRATNE